MLLIGAPLSATLTPNAGFTAGGRLICTNASPPRIRAARFESTRISGPAPTADVDNEQASTAAGNNKRHIELIVHFILIPPRNIRSVDLLFEPSFRRDRISVLRFTTPIRILS